MSRYVALFGPLLATPGLKNGQKMRLNPLRESGSTNDSACENTSLKKKLAPVFFCIIMGGKGGRKSQSVQIENSWMMYF
jgi:hypothetical protein